MLTHPSETHAKSNSAIVLVVDDDPYVRTFVSRVLARSGYGVLEAPDGASAFEICGRSAVRVDLVLSDIQMPKLSGWGLADALAATGSHIKVILMSGKPVVPMANNQRPVWPINVLKKPFRPDALIARVTAALARDVT